jgi:hypothetical protein
LHILPKLPGIENSQRFKPNGTEIENVTTPEAYDIHGDCRGGTLQEYIPKQGYIFLTKTPHKVIGMPIGKSRKFRVWKSHYTVQTIEQNSVAANRVHPEGGPSRKFPGKSADKTRRVSGESGEVHRTVLGVLGFKKIVYMGEYGVLFPFMPEGFWVQNKKMLHVSIHVDLKKSSR